MSGENQKGFTIIEVSMFLGILALLMVGLISGITLSIQRQRYTDSIQSTHSFLQRQFNETLNVINNRNTETPCPSGIDNRGSSNCFILGKLIVFDVGGNQIAAQPIISTRNATDVEVENAADEEEVLSFYQPQVQQDANEETYRIPWDARITSANFIDSFELVGDRVEGEPGEAIEAIAIVRSPKSGAVFVYGVPDPQSGPLIDQLTADHLDPSQICIASQDIIGVAPAAITFMGIGTQDAVLAQVDGTEGRCS